MLGPVQLVVDSNSQLFSITFFADDCLLYRHIRNDEDATALQKDLTSLQQWEETWQMQFHPQNNLFSFGQGLG
jgi:hypothetical protein